MIEVMSESQGNVIGVKFSGKITTREYEETFIPRLEAILKEHGKARLMYVVDEGFEGAEAGAVWDDTKLGVKHRHDFEKLLWWAGPNGWSGSPSSAPSSSPAKPRPFLWSNSRKPGSGSNHRGDGPDEPETAHRARPPRLRPALPVPS
jgi:hypothetical protein